MELWRRASLVCIGLAAAACAQLTPLADGTSLSYGWTNRGVIVNATELPIRGDGYLIPSPWAGRRLNWGTEELVALLVRAGRRLHAEAPGRTLYIGDLSPRTGGASAWHRSHQTGRDADLVFFAVDEKGGPVGAPTGMGRFDENGNSIDRRRFDAAMNWRLVRALLQDPVVDVQFLFISNPLKAKLIAYAVELGEPIDLIERARAVLLQPGDALPHDDHLHVRIFCPISDRTLGCHDRGPYRWFKKSFKYLRDTGRSAASLHPLVPFCQVLAAKVLALR